MTSALVSNGTVVDFYPGDVPNPIIIVDGNGVSHAVYCATVGWVGSDGTAGYSILPAVMDSAPDPTSYPTGEQSYAISNGQVQVTRTWVTPPPPPPTSVQVQSTSTPALNGTYGIDARSQSRMMAVVMYTQVNSGKFPGGVSSIPYYDTSGTAHTFTSASQFQAFATAIADYVAALDFGQTPATPLVIP